jgi:hypothetical protein
LVVAVVVVVAHTCRRTGSVVVVLEVSRCETDLLDGAKWERIFVEWPETALEQALEHAP